MIRLLLAFLAACGDALQGPAPRPSRAFALRTYASVAPEDGKSVFVKNLHFHADAKDLTKVCEKFYGKVDRVWIPEGKGFGSVFFASAAAANKALEAGEVKVRGRPAYLVANTRPGGARADAIRSLHSAARGPRAPERRGVLEALAVAGSPRDARELGIAAAALAAAKARRECLEVLASFEGAPTSAYNAALAALRVESAQDAALAADLVAAAPEANCRTFGSAIGACKRGGGYKDSARAFHAAAVDAGQANAVVHNELIACYGRCGDWRAALDALEDMFESELAPDEVSLNAAIHACASAGEVGAAARVFEVGFARAGCYPTKVTFNSLLRASHAAAKKRRSGAPLSEDEDARDRASTVQRVREILQKMAQCGERPDDVTVNSALSAYGACGAVDSAKRLFSGALRDGTATTVTANAYLNALAVAGDARQAADVLRKTLPESGIRSDATSWNTAIAACAGVDASLAEELLDAMPPHFGDRSSYAYASALAGVDKAQGADAAKRLLRRADDAGAATTVVLNAALAALDRCGDFAGVRQLLETGFEARGVSADAVSWNTALWSLARPEHAPHEALEVFEAMVAGRATAPPPDSRSYGAAVAAAAQSGDHEAALDLLTRAGPLADGALHNDVLKACATAAAPEAALDLVETMDRRGLVADAVGVTSLLTAAARAGRAFPEAFARFDALDAPDVAAFNAAISLADRAGDQRLAMAYFRALAEHGALAPDATSFCAAITACERSDTPKWRTALALLKGSLQALDAPDAACYVATMQTLVAAKELDRALKLLDDACVRDFDAQSRFSLHRTLQVGCVAAGRLDTATELGLAMDRDNLRGLRPLARARLRGRLVSFDNDGNRATTDALRRVKALQKRAAHAFVTSALPVDFQKTAPIAAQEASLLQHAEKKALAALLDDPDAGGSAGPLLVEINFKMCADCHAFFKACSEALGRTLSVREPSTTHIFADGACSCKDAWRWEARHASHAEAPAPP